MQKETQYERALRHLHTVDINDGDIIKAAAEGILRGDYIPAIAEMVLGEEFSATIGQIEQLFDLVLEGATKK